MSGSERPLGPGDAEPTLVEKVLHLHDALDAVGVPHALGGALALAYYTDDPRTTADIDVNVAIDAQGADVVFAALPRGVEIRDEDRERARRDEQVRLWWGRTPVDLFFRASSFHDGVAGRVRWHPFGATTLPFLAADDLAVLRSE